MRVIPLKSFAKAFGNLPAGIRAKAIDALASFAEDPFSPRLNNHALF